MTPTEWTQLGALAVATATFGLNYADLRHRRELTDRVQGLAQRPPPPQPPPPTPPAPQAPPSAAPVSPTAALPPPRPLTTRPAPWSLKRRSIAFFIDLYLGAIPFAFLPVDDEGRVAGTEAQESGATLMMIAIWLAQLLLSGTTGWTLGRKLLGGRLVDATTGEPIGLTRNLLHFVALAGLSWIPALGVFRSDERRGWHDDWVHARLISTRAPRVAV
jgi:hypothetical protein